ncbi:MAG: DUF5916 domain-containing protein [Anaeromyxobacteraceae bacterium]
MTLLRAALVLALAAACGPLVARASQAGDPITAAKRSSPIVLDGKVDEEAWATAPVFDGFVQAFPTQGARPSQDTEVRVLYDDRDLWVAVVAHDREPDQIQRPLGRRDTAPYSDMVAVVVDPLRDGRLGYYFEATAGGVLTDALVFDSDKTSTSWDAVWEAATVERPDGWSAEFRIPLSVMRYSEAPVQTWGFAVKRQIGRTHEQDLTCIIPPGARGQIARLGPLVGLADMAPVPEVQLAPYVAGRVTSRPTDPDQDRARPRLLDPVMNLGLDLRASLGRSMALVGTLNPDFGQVEADEILQNLSNFELQLPEKRPFFLQGMDLFEPIRLGGTHNSPLQLFYSRRVGLDAPILAAAKVTGQLGDDFQIGVLDTIVDGAGWGRLESDPAHPAGGAGFSWRQPLQVGPRSALPRQQPAARNFLAAVGRWRPAPDSSVGLSLASALPLDPLCSASDLAADDAQPRCDALGGNSASADGSWRTADKEWFLQAQLTGSQVQGGPPSRTLGDGVVLSRGDLGYGGFVAAGKNGGRGLGGELHHVYSSPKLDLNATGYQRTQNEEFTRGYLLWNEPEGKGTFQQWDATVGFENAFTTDARHLNRWGQVWAEGEVQLRSFDWVGMVVASDVEAWDVREVSQTGAAQRRPTTDWFQVFMNSSSERPVGVVLQAGGGRSRARDGFDATVFYGANATVRFRPHPRVETRVGFDAEHTGWPTRYVDDAGANDPANPFAGQRVFADLRAPLFSLTLRQQLVITPRLTLQGYAQLFTSYGRYRNFRVAPGGDTRVGYGDYTRLPAATAATFAIDDPDFREVGLNVNVVMRWEYRAGSTLFLVYTRSQAEPGDGVASPHRLAPQALAHGPTTDSFLVKWTYFWAR